MAYDIPINSNFGDLTVIAHAPPHIEPSGHRRAQVRVRCKCGQEYEICSYNLKRGTSKKCKRCAYDDRRKISLGEVFDKLTVVGHITQGRRSFAECRCSCGNTVKIRPSSLKANQTNNCGCAPRGAWSGVGLLSSTFLYRMKRNARTRGLPFEVEASQLWELLEKQGHKCALTGTPIQLNPKSRGKSTASVDRLDNSKGYMIDNIQWVHKDINIMRGALSMDRFLLLCSNVSTHSQPEK